MRFQAFSVQDKRRFSLFRLRQVYVQSVNVQRAPRQLRLKSSRKYKLQVCAPLLSFLHFPMFVCVGVCVKTGKKMTSHYLAIYCEDVLLYTALLSDHAPWLFHTTLQ